MGRTGSISFGPKKTPVATEEGPVGAMRCASSRREQYSTEFPLRDHQCGPVQPREGGKYLLVGGRNRREA